MLKRTDKSTSNAYNAAIRYDDTVNWYGTCAQSSSRHDPLQISSKKPDNTTSNKKQHKNRQNTPKKAT